MPAIKIHHLVSVSSEDQNHPASNLLKEEEYKKWKCSAGGHNQATVILQFEKSSKISGVDIGNEGSAFVEVLVGKMSDNDSSYKVLLVASSFMTPLESRAGGQNANRVRMFATDKLCKEVVDDSWDRVKIVCTQPYNKGAQYGLSFIKFHSPAEAQPTNMKTSTSLGAFTLKEEKDEAVLTPGSLFAQRKGTLQTSGALEVRQASHKDEISILKAKKTPILSPATPKQKNSEKDVSDKGKSSRSETQLSEKRKTQPISSETSSTKKSRTKDEPSEVDFSRLMSGVVFALSGFVNPSRADLRDKAIAMGAKYRPDWDSTCTHLICAFSNTPKFNQVKSSNGKIATKEWILDCHRKKKPIPWTDYNMRSGEKTQSKAVKDEKQQPKSVEKASKAKDEVQSLDDNDDDYGGSTDVDSDQPDNKYDTDTEMDTDDEIQDFVRTKGGGSERNGSVKKDDQDEERSGGDLPQLPDYFGGRLFFVYGDLEEKQRRKLSRYIIAFNGKEAANMSDSVDYVVTCSEWDDTFDEALNSNKNLVFVQPQWVFECGRRKRWIPYQPFIVSA